jgi:hypothetical protein
MSRKERACITYPQTGEKYQTDFKEIEYKLGTELVRLR